MQNNTLVFYLILLHLLFILNKYHFLSFASQATYCTFVSSITTKRNNKAHADRIDTNFETFHEIIYGKPARCKRASRFFFVGTFSRDFGCFIILFLIDLLR